MNENDARSVLIVDDEPAVRETLSLLLEGAGIDALVAGSADEALASSRARDFDAVLSDIRMPDKDGVALLGELRAERPETPVILMTAYGSSDSAVEAVRDGAFDYIQKPFERGTVIASLERAFERRALEQEIRRLRRELDLVESAVSERMNLDDLTALYTKRVLELVEGNKVRAARILGINRRTLYRRDARRSGKDDERNS